MPSEKKTCVITGASGGIGLCTAKRFVSEGYNVAICGRRKEPLESATAELEGGSADVISVCGDVADEETRKLLVAKTTEQWGRIDVLVNNAGAAPLSEFPSIDAKTFESVLDINVRAVFFLTQLVWPMMVEAGQGSIVNISSLAAIDPFPGFSIYGASKSWVELFTKAIAGEGEANSIRACCVRPGAVETDLLRGLFPDFPADQCVSPDDIAEKIWGCVAQPGDHPSGEAFTVSK